MSKPANRTAPLLIALMIGLFVLFLYWAGHRAANYGPSISDTEYYSKGLKYNDTLVEKRAAKILGWALTAELNGRRLVLHLRDGDQHPVTGAEAVLRLSRVSDREESYPLTESTPGNYAVLLPVALSGELRAVAEFEHNSALLTRQLLLNFHP